jgi:hypothetical protein
VEEQPSSPHRNEGSPFSFLLLLLLPMKEEEEM